MDAVRSMHQDGTSHLGMVGTHRDISLPVEFTCIGLSVVADLVRGSEAGVKKRTHPRTRLRWVK